MTNFQNYPYSVVLDIPFNPHANADPPTLYSQDVQDSAIAQAKQLLENVIQQQSHLEKEITSILGISTKDLDFSMGGNEKAYTDYQTNVPYSESEIYKFTKQFRHALAVLSTSTTKEERLQAFRVLMALTKQTSLDWDDELDDMNRLSIVANEISLLQRDVYVRYTYNKERRHKAGGRSREAIKKTFDIQKAQNAAFKELLEFIQILKEEQKSTQEHLSFDQAVNQTAEELMGNFSQYLSVKLVASRAGYAFEPLINKSKITYLQNKLKNSGWTVTGGAVENTLRYQYEVVDDKLQKKSTGVLDRIDEWIGITKKVKKGEQQEKLQYGFAFSDKLRLGITNIDIQSTTSLQNITDILKNSPSQYQIESFIFLALNTAYASAYSSGNTENMLDFLNKIFSSFVFDLVFNPNNFAAQVLKDFSNKNILYLTQIGTTVSPSYVILQKTLDAMELMQTTAKIPAIHTSFTRDTTPAKTYYDEIVDNPKYINGSLREGRGYKFNTAAWNYVAYQVNQNTNIRLSLDAQQLNNFLFGS